MDKKDNGESILELINKLEINEKVIEKALLEFQEKKITISAYMHSSVDSTICISQLDWTYLIGLNEQKYIYISEHPFEARIGNNLIFDVDNIDEVEYNKNTLRIWFKDGLRIYICNEN